MQYSKIVCPTDFSEPAELALRHALEMARGTPAALHLVHVVEPSSAPMGFAPRVAEEMMEIQQSQEQYAHKQLEDLAHKPWLRDPGVDLRTEVLVGNPADAIVEYGREEQADLIVTATHGDTGWRRWVFGSVAEVVVRKAPCPVLVIPAPDGEAGEGSAAENVEGEGG